MTWAPIGAALAACVVSLVLTGLSIAASRRFRLLDQPEARKVHKQPTPRLGGIGIVGAAVIVGVPAFYLLSDSTSVDSQRYVALLVGALCVFAVGVADDLCGVSSKLKLLTLLAASSVFCASGAGFHNLSSDAFVVADVPTWLSWIVTAIWITGMAVAFNFIDGLDGLSGGIALLACAVLGYFQLANHNFAEAVPSLVVAGAVAGFLHFNRPPAKTFMGDGGSLTLGYLIGALTLAANSDPNLGTMRAVVVPSLAMSVAIVDAALTMFRRRYQQRRSMFTAERGHIHHRLLDRGLRPQQAVLVIHFVSAVAVAIGVFSLRFTSWSTLGGLALVVPLLWGLFHAAGSVRTSEMVSAVRKKRSIDKTSRLYRSVFEQLQLEFDEASNFSGWWQTVCDAAERLHFSRVELPVETAGGERRSFRWVNDLEGLEPSYERIDATIPIPQVGVSGTSSSSSAAVSVPIVSTLESAGERLALFSRLMAENGFAALKRIHGAESVRDDPKELAPGEFGHLRVAVVHDGFSNYTVAERVVEQLIKLFPHCDVFGLYDFLADEQRGFLHGKNVRTTFLQNMPFARAYPQAYLPLMPLAIEQLDLSDYDLVVSSSRVAAKGVITSPDQLHICYCHSSARFAWAGPHPSGRDRGLRVALNRIFLHYFRNWDARSALGVDSFIANSRFTARQIEKTYRREAEVIYPPIATEGTPDESSASDNEYYLTSSCADDYKLLGLICETFNDSPHRNVIVIGDADELKRLQRLAGPNVDFVARHDRATVMHLMQGARAFICAAEEGFCAETVEGMSCGVPAVAFRNSGVAELIPNEGSGVVFEQLSSGALQQALEQIERREPLDEVGRKTVRQASEQCSVEQFIDQMSEFLRRQTREQWKTPPRPAMSSSEGEAEPDPPSQLAPEASDGEGDRGWDGV